MTLFKSLFGGILIGLITVLGKYVIVALEQSRPDRYDSYGLNNFGLPPEWVGALFSWLFVAIVGYFVGKALAKPGSITRRALRLLIFPSFYYGAGIGMAILMTNLESVPVPIDCLQTGVGFLLTPWLVPGWLAFPICTLFSWMMFHQDARQPQVASPRF